MPLALEDLLDRTRDALVSGDFDALSALAPAVMAEAESLGRLPERDARRLQRKADRNARLLQAAARGLRAAQDRVAQIAAGPTLATYDAQGRRAVLAAPAPTALGRF